jgi:hypothetical protein
MVDLGHIRIVDQHCHGLVAVDAGDPGAWRACFTESRDPAMASVHVPQSLSYRRLLLSLAELLGCPSDEEAVLAARARRTDLLPELVADAGIDTLILDRGFPGAGVLPDQEWWRAGARTASLLRLEPLMERLVREQGSLPALEEALVAALQDVRGHGSAGLKSIVAYRSGLEVRDWTRDEVAAALAEARARASRGPYRIEEKPLLDHLLSVALGQAAAQELPVQFHAGYGDVDADLRLGNPLHLRWLLERPELRGLSIVLLHGCYPYTREGAYLAAVYDHVHLDLSYGIPFLGLSELEACSRAALAVAPTSKLLYSSDGVAVPELHWMAAHDGRRALGAALGEAVRQGELTEAQAMGAGEAVLAGNARSLYGV